MSSVKRFECPYCKWHACKLARGIAKGGEIRDTRTVNLSRNIVSLQVFVDVSHFSPCMINLSRNKHICWGLLKVDPRSTFRNKFWLCC